MPEIKDGPASTLFAPVPLTGNTDLDALGASPVSSLMAQNTVFAPTGACVNWGIPFDTTSPVLVQGQSHTFDFKNTAARWLVFSHVLDISEQNQKSEQTIQLFGMNMPVLGPMPTGPVANYVFIYEDGSEHRVTIKSGFQIGPFATRLDENCFEAVTHIKSQMTRFHDTDLIRNQFWGRLQQQTYKPDFLRTWINWLWAWENPAPEKKLSSLRIEPTHTPLLIFGVSAGNVAENPLRWGRRQKAILKLEKGEQFNPSQAHPHTTGIPLEEGAGGYHGLSLDMGQIISAQPRRIYTDSKWTTPDNEAIPTLCTDEILVDYTSHPDGHFHIADGRTVPVKALEENGSAAPFQLLPQAVHKIRIRIIDKATRMPVAVRLHIHGEAGEYHAPQDRHRIPNANWFQDQGVDHVQAHTHFSSYIDGTTNVYLPKGQIYVEISKGFEVAPLRRILSIDGSEDEIKIEVENQLDWRSKGWVTADTHVHFLSPQSALLEGAAEGVNIVNLLASQWGEMMTNAGDFDGKTTFGEQDSVTGGEYLVRVGTENRQSVLGHISLLGYEDQIILPLASGGPSESALGDPVASLLTDWAEQCKKQKGTVVIPHFPLPRGEHAATIVEGLADAVELSSLGGIAMGGISPYSLVDWYRYLNCGYFTAAVGGTDKMSADIAVGAARTYAQLQEGEPLTYKAWQAAIERGRTFVTLGPLVDFSVDGSAPGARLNMPATGGSVDIDWLVESVTLPISSVELIVNGECMERQKVTSNKVVGHWRVTLEKSSWLALLVRSNKDEKTEMITAHTSPVAVHIENSAFMATTDAVSILDQIEGVAAYLDTLGTKTDKETYQRMRARLTAVHRHLHNRLHKAGIHHHHNSVSDHDEHH